MTSTTTLTYQQPSTVSGEAQADLERLQAEAAAVRSGRTAGDLVAVTAALMAAERLSRDLAGEADSAAWHAGGAAREAQSSRLRVEAARRRLAVARGGPRFDEHPNAYLRFGLLGLSDVEMLHAQRMWPKLRPVSRVPAGRR